LSSISSLPLLAKTVTHPAARSLCDSWASCSQTFKQWGRTDEISCQSVAIWEKVDGDH